MSRHTHFETRFPVRIVPIAALIAMKEIANRPCDVDDTRWLLDHHEYLGCTFESKVLRVDGYRTWRLRGRKNIEISTLDFEGTLTVNNQQRFMEAALKGIGPAKAFGCGLLLVRRV